MVKSHKSSVVLKTSPRTANVGFYLTLLLGLSWYMDTPACSRALGNTGDSFVDRHVIHVIRYAVVCYY